jgi:hypothetical protein
MTMKLAVKIAIGVIVFVCFASAVSCTQSGRQVDDQSKAAVDIDDAEIADASVSITNRIGDADVTALSNISAGGGEDGLELEFTSAMLVNPSMALTSPSPIRIRVPRSMIVIERISISRTATVSARRAKIVRSKITIDQRIGASRTASGGSVVAYVRGSLPDGGRIEAIELPEEYVHNDINAAARVADVGGWVVPIEIASGTGIEKTYLGIPASAR